MTVSFVSRVSLVIVVVSSFTMPAAVFASDGSDSKFKPRDRLRAEISITNHTGTKMGIAGCVMAQGQCIPYATHNQASEIQEGETRKVGRVEGSGTGLEGGFTYYMEELPGIYIQRYSFGSNPSLSHLVTGAYTQANVDPKKVAIDYQRCTQNPSAYEAMRCCTYKEKKLTSKSMSYEYECVLPITIEE